MAKTQFASGVIVTSQWLNGAQRIVFDGQNLDWHYDPLGLDSLVTKGPNGLDSRYITLDTNQPVLSTTGIFLTGQPITGDKVVTGSWSFGFDPEANLATFQNFDNAPKSFLTNSKYENANGENMPTPAQKYAALSDADLLTKAVLTEQLNNLIIDNGEY